MTPFIDKKKLTTTLYLVHFHDHTLMVSVSALRYRECYYIMELMWLSLSCLEINRHKKSLETQFSEGLSNNIVSNNLAVCPTYSYTPLKLLMKALVVLKNLHVVSNCCLNNSRKFYFKDRTKRQFS